MRKYWFRYIQHIAGYSQLFIYIYIMYTLYAIYNLKLDLARTILNYINYWHIRV